MSGDWDGPLGELPIRNRNRIDRMSSVVNEDHQALHELVRRVDRLDRAVAEQGVNVQRIEALVGQLLAITRGTGATTANREG